MCLEGQSLGFGARVALCCYIEGCELKYTYRELLMSTLLKRIIEEIQRAGW